MLRKFAALLLAAAAFAPAAMAQTIAAHAPVHAAPPETVKYMSAAEVTALTDKPGPGAHTAYPVDHESYFVEYATRTTEGNVAEVHAHWTHYIHVLSGQATLTTGGKVVNAKDTAYGQVRGDSISGGATHVMHPGDFVQIPAGTPHLFNNIAPGVKFHYVVFNVRQ